MELHSLSNFLAEGIHRSAEHFSGIVLGQTEHFPKGVVFVLRGHIFQQIQADIGYGAAVMN